MQVLYKTEIAWTAQALAEKAGQLKRMSEMEATTAIERGAYQLRAEQLQGIAERLAAAVADGDRRIAIR